MRRWVLVSVLMAAVVGGGEARGASGAPQELSLHELQDPRLPVPVWGTPVKKVVDVSTLLPVDASRWPPRLSAPLPPKDVLAEGHADFERRFWKALKPRERAAQLRALRQLLPQATDAQAYFVWWQLAAFHDRPAARERALRQAIAMGARARKQSANIVRLALLETLAWRGDEDERLKLSAQILAAAPTSETKRIALGHAKDALLNGARARTALVPMELVLQLAEDLSGLATHGAGGSPRQALELISRYGDKPMKQLAQEGISAHDQRISEQPWLDGEEDPMLNVHGPLYSLVRDCLALNAAPKEPLTLTVGPGGGRPTVNVTPLEPPLARCLVDRGPEYLQWVKVRVQAELPFGKKPGVEGQMRYESFVIVGTYRGLAQAQRQLQRLKKPLGLRATREQVDPKTDEWHFRGRWDGGAYLSIEDTDAYAELENGHYIVVAASGAPRSPTVTRVLQRARRAGVNAYVRDLKVYTGCMH